MFRHKSSAQPVEIARQAAGAATGAAVTAAQSARQSARSLASNIDLSDVRDSLSDTMGDVRDSLSDTMGDVRGSVSTELAKNAEVVTDSTRSHPVRALLIALGLGAVMGAAVDRMVTSRSKGKHQAPVMAAAPDHTRVGG